MSQINSEMNDELYQSLTNHNLQPKQRHQVVVKKEILLANHNMKKQIHLIQKKRSKMTALVLFIKVIKGPSDSFWPIRRTQGRPDGLSMTVEQMY